MTLASTKIAVKVDPPCGLQTPRQQHRRQQFTLQQRLQQRPQRPLLPPPLRTLSLAPPQEATPAPRRWRWALAGVAGAAAGGGGGRARWQPRAARTLEQRGAGPTSLRAQRVSSRGSGGSRDASAERERHEDAWRRCGGSQSVAETTRTMMSPPPIGATRLSDGLPVSAEWYSEPENRHVPVARSATGTDCTNE